MASRGKISIRARILISILLLLAVTFLLIQVAFNYLVRDYILSSVQAQLGEVLRITPGRSTIGLPLGPAGSGQFIIVTRDYDLVVPDLGLTYLENFKEVYVLARALAAEKVNLDSNKIMNLRASGRDYYFVSVNQPGSYYYYIFYFDMTAISAFADRINTTLVWVMAVAGLLAVGLAFFLSGVIARPVRELTRFATRLGQGDFRTSSPEYRDAELAELAESMNWAAQQLESYDREQKTFFQNVSHELRTPLQAIRSNAEGIQHGILDSQQSSGVIIDEADRLREMVDGLLYLSRMDSSLGTAKKERLDLREVISNSAETLRPLAEKGGISLTFEFDPEPVEVVGDEEGLSRAFSNLIANAIRYADSRITLSCRLVQGRAVARVADDGPGISDQDLPHIFDRFYKGLGGKHGIGLSIAQAVVQQHGGEIQVHNDQGAVFTVTLEA
ncbi:MAG: sensor histidine kinase [Bacillota bacterium]